MLELWRNDAELPRPPFDERAIAQLLNIATPEYHADCEAGMGVEAARIIGPNESV